MDEKKDGGRVVYSRPDAEGGEGEPRSSMLRRAIALGGAYDSLWRTLVPLVVGFALLVVLVFGLGYLSAARIREVSLGAKEEDRRLSATSNTLLNLRLALTRLDTEARLRGRIEAGTGDVMMPPSDLRLRNARGEAVSLLTEFDALPLGDATKKRDVHERVAAYIEITKDLRDYSLNGFAAARDLEENLRTLMGDVAKQRTLLDEQLVRTLAEAQSGIKFLMWLAALTGLVVASATFLEVWRRFRQMRRSYAELRRERQFSSQMLEGMPSAVAAIDRSDRIRSANAAFFSVFPGAQIDISIHDKFATTDGLKLLAAATSTRVKRTAYRGRFLLPSDGGSKEQVFDVYSSPLEIDGEAGQLLTLVDVTEAAESERGLRRQEALAAVGQAAAQVAHEIKNPLGSIRLGVAMLRDMTRNREAVTTIDLVERGIEHLSKLTLDVTQFSRRRQLTLADTDLAVLLNESLDLVAEKLREKRTPVERHFPSEPVCGNWDEDQLRQVFVNLIANAVDAGAAESPVTLSAERVTLNSSERRNGEGGRQVAGARISVADRGQGVDEQTRARIFEPFFTTKKKGTGLGLAIAKQIVEQHGGSIRVESAPGKGTRFVIELPLSPEAV
ncbi:MAG: two-component system, sensor histidine kinase FlrB [Acidobacteriota bacterium]|jgi:signal transduction histidine kinase|nr:two-component system, sensor histidine kinase FlrB [Acidobacteriota bacterium]